MDTTEANPTATQTTPSKAAERRPQEGSAATDPASAEPADEAAPEATADSTAVDSHAEASTAPAEDYRPSRSKLEEQLHSLKRREAELRRELAIADHPELTDAIRELESRAYCIARAEAKLAEGLTKAEERRRDTLSKKVDGLTAKRDALNVQLAELQSELSALGEDRIRAFRSERREALEQLVASLGAHTAALRDADLDLSNLLPQIDDWMPEIRAVAEELAAGVKPS